MRKGKQLESAPPQSNKNRPGYVRPRIGEERRVHRAFKIDKMTESVRSAIVRMRNEHKTWAQIGEAVGLHASLVNRWYIAYYEPALSHASLVKRTYENLKEAHPLEPDRFLRELTGHLVAVAQARERRDLDAEQKALFVMGMWAVRASAAKGGWQVHLPGRPKKQPRLTAVDTAEELLRAHLDRIQR